MTRRSEFRHRYLELKSVLMTWMAGKLFTFRDTGLDGWFKRRMLPREGQGKPDSRSP